MVQVFKRSAATALVAMVQKLSLREEVDAAAFDALLTQVCLAPEERTSLLLAIRQTNDPDLRLILTDRLRAFASEQTSRADGIGGRDSAFGPWAQAFTGSLVVLAIGSMVQGALSFGLGIPAFLVASAMLGVVTHARLRAAGVKVDAARKAALANDLIKSIGESRTDPADAPKAPRK